MTTIPASSLPSLSASAVSRALGAAGFRVVPLDDARRRGAGISVSRSTLGEVSILVTFTASKAERVAAEIEDLLPSLGLRLRSKDRVGGDVSEATIFLYVQRAPEAEEAPAPALTKGDRVAWVRDTAMRGRVEHVFGDGELAVRWDGSGERVESYSPAQLVAVDAPTAALVYCTAHNPRGTVPTAHLEAPECREPHYAAPTLAPKSTSPEYRLLERILAAQAGATAPTVEALELLATYGRDRQEAGRDAEARFAAGLDED